MKRPTLTVSTTEAIQFQSCRRRWLLSRMYTPRQDAPNLWFGTLIHHALEAYFKRDRDRKAMATAYRWHSRRDLRKLRDEYGSLWPNISESYYAIIALGQEILRNYVSWDIEAEVQLGDPVAVERRLFIPLGDRNFLAVRMDLLATLKGAYQIVDHKTASKHWTTSGMGRTLDLDEQLTSYAYAFWRLTHHVADAIIYDVLYKEVPAEPSILKNGTLSKAVSQPTTLNKYRQKIEELGLDEDDYFDILDTLEARGWDGFFAREVTYRNLEQIKAYESKLAVLFDDMRSVLADWRRAYPSPSVLKCPSCPFLSVCEAIEDGSDYQYLLDTGYTLATGNPWKTPHRLKEKT